MAGSQRVTWAYLGAVSAASTTAGPQLVSVLPVRLDPSHVGERDFIAAIALVSVAQDHVVDDVTLQETREGASI